MNDYAWGAIGGVGCCLAVIGVLAFMFWEPDRV